MLECGNDQNPWRPTMLHGNQGTVVSQVESLQRQFAQAPGLPFAELLPTERIGQVLQEQGMEFRDRDYPPLTLAMFLSQCSDTDPSRDCAMDAAEAAGVRDALPRRSRAKIPGSH